MSKANLAAEMNDANAEAQPGSEEWAVYGVQTSSGSMRKPAPESLVLIGSSGLIMESDSPIGHLLTTRWHQNSPYNQYIPLRENGKEHYPAGCSPVAVAQYFYYWHNKYGKPINSVTSASYDFSNNKYIFSGWSSTVWDSMPLGNGLISPTLQEASPVALLIGNLARIMETTFDEDSTGASGSTVRDKYVSCINVQSGQNLSLKQFSSERIYNMIKSGNPVVTGLGADGIGHTVVTDYTRREYGYRDYYYVPAKLVDTTIPWEEGMGPRPGNYGSGDIKTERMLVLTSYYFRMNWGYGPNASDPEINGAVLKVTYQNSTYNSIYAVY